MIIQTLTTSFKKELLEGVHDFSTDSFKIALYTSSASLGADTTAYTSTGEVSSPSTLFTSQNCVLNYLSTGSPEATLTVQSATLPPEVAIGQLVTGDYIPSNTYVTGFTQEEFNPYWWSINISNLVTTSQYNPILYTTASFYGTSYTPGGNTLTVNPTPTSSGTTAYVSFDNVSWTNASFITAGGLIYNSSKANRSVAVLNFGNNKTANGTFTVTFPTATATTAIIRIA